MEVAVDREVEVALVGARRAEAVGLAHVGVRLDVVAEGPVGGIGEPRVVARERRVLQRDEFLNPADPTFKNRILGELGDPKNQVNVNLSAKYKNVTFGYQFRWIDKMYLNTYEDFNGLNGLPPQNLDYASVQKYPSVAYVDIRAAVDVSEGFNFYAGIDNLFNRKPPYGLTGVGGGSGIYDNRGQYFYAGVVAKF